MVCVPEGVGLIVQDLPFQTSPSDRNAKLEVRESPTALQNFVETQETPSRELPTTPDGLGGKLMAHFEPFQISDKRG